MTVFILEIIKHENDNSVILYVAIFITVLKLFKFFLSWIFNLQITSTMDVTMFCRFPLVTIIARAHQMFIWINVSCSTTIYCHYFGALTNFVV